MMLTNVLGASVPTPKGLLTAATFLVLGCSGNTENVHFQTGGSGGSQGASTGGAGASGGAGGSSSGGASTGSGGSSAGGVTTGGTSGGGRATSGTTGSGGAGGTMGGAGGTMGGAGGTMGGAGATMGGAGATGGAGTVGGAGGTGGGAGGGAADCNGAAGCVLTCPFDAPCTCECPAEDTCGGVVCGAGETCFGTSDCGYCGLEGTDPPIPQCTMRPCGDQGLECAESGTGRSRQLCVRRVSSMGPVVDTTYHCIPDTCNGALSCEAACASNVCLMEESCSLSGDATIVCNSVGACASPETAIETPAGPRPIAELGVGDLVYSTNQHGFVVVPILRVSRTPQQDHHVMRVILDTGATLEISEGHPTADGRLFSDLVEGGSLDGRRIAASERVPYRHPFTYDILPASSTGTYVAAGVLIGTTLRR